MRMKRKAAGALLAVMMLGIAASPASGDTRGPIGQIGDVPTDSTGGTAPHIDFEQMSVEDAILLMFALLAADARQDVFEMLNELDASRLAREALRDAETLLRGQTLAGDVAFQRGEPRGCESLSATMRATPPLGRVGTRDLS